MVSTKNAYSSSLEYILYGKPEKRDPAPYEDPGPYEDRGA